MNEVINQTFKGTLQKSLIYFSLRFVHVIYYCIKMSVSFVISCKDCIFSPCMQKNKDMILKRKNEIFKTVC